MTPRRFFPHWTVARFDDGMTVNTMRTFALGTLATAGAGVPPAPAAGAPASSASATTVASVTNETASAAATVRRIRHAPRFSHPLRVPIDAWEAGELCSPRTIAGGFGPRGAH